MPHGTTGNFNILFQLKSIQWHSCCQQVWGLANLNLNSACCFQSLHFFFHPTRDHQRHSHTDMALIKRLLNPEEVCVRSFRGTILTSEYNLELGPPLSTSPLSLLDPTPPAPIFCQLTFSGVLLLLFSPSLSEVCVQFFSTGEVRAVSPTKLTDSKRLVCEASLEFICLNSFSFFSYVAPSLCPLFEPGEMQISTHTYTTSPWVTAPFACTCAHVCPYCISFNQLWFPWLSSQCTHRAKNW